MKKTLYYDCFSGISGDMNLGALIDLGVDTDYLKKELKKLNLRGYEFIIKEDQRNGIRGINLDVKITEEQHHHTSFSAIKQIISDSKLSQRIKIDSLKIFEAIAKAEAKIHSTSINKVHFHEVGAIDSIVDIVGAAICLDYLKIDKIISSTVVLGSGFVKCEHGILPVPAPATLEILKSIPVIKGDIPFEATTPTGAGFLAALANQFTDDIKLNIEKIGYGIGNKVGIKPNMLRVMMGECISISDKQIENNIMLECNVDDMNPEHFDFLFEVLFKHGAYDAHVTPIIMKKSRPAFGIKVLCSLENSEDLIKQLYYHTTTLGIKKYPVQKHFLKREFVNRQTPWGTVKCKQSFFNGQQLHEKPEYDDCKKLAIENNIRIEQIKNYLYADRKI